MKKLIIATAISFASVTSVSAAPSLFAEAIGRAVTGYSGTPQVQQTAGERTYPGFQPWGGRRTDLFDDSRMDTVRMATRDPRATRTYFENHGFRPARYQ